MGHTTRLHQAVPPQHAGQAHTGDAANHQPAASAAPSPLVPLQQSIGNRAVGRLVQAKLKVGRPGDRIEREADRVADEVTHAPEPKLTKDATIVPVATSAATSRRSQMGLQGKPFAGQPTGQAGAAPASVDRALASPGRPLDPTLQEDMEERFGHDFSGGGCRPAPGRLPTGHGIRTGSAPDADAFTAATLRPADDDTAFAAAAIGTADDDPAFSAAAVRASDDDLAFAAATLRPSDDDTACTPTAASYRSEFGRHRHTVWGHQHGNAERSAICVCGSRGWRDCKSKNADYPTG
jgi:hypothetical protein